MQPQKVKITDLDIAEIITALDSTETQLSALKGKFPVSDLWYALTGQKAYLLEEIHKRVAVTK